jgi:glycosyltransferase involved in cell wall biosynthesis
MRKKVFFRGPVLTRSGYGEQARFALRSLRSREDLFEVFIQPIKWGQTSWTSEMDEEREWIDNTIEKTIAYMQSGGQFDMSLQVTIPNEFQRVAPINIGYTAGIETNKVAPEWLQKGNEQVDKIITISTHSKQVYENTVATAQNQQTGETFEYRLNTPVEYVSYPTKVFDTLPDLNLDLTTSFNFLTVAQYGPRKNLVNTIKWFVEEFCKEDVGLVVKTNIAKNSLADRQRSFSALRSILASYPDRQCKVYLIHGDLTDAEMHSLYKNEKIDAFLALPHGEGFGLPIFEASYSGLPVVATGWSGHLDFLTDTEGNEHFFNVAFDLQPVQQEVVWNGVLIKESMWAYPREQSAKEKMRLCYEVMTNEETRGTEMIALEQNAKRLHETFSVDKMYKQFVDNILGFDSSLIEQQQEEEIVLEFE